MPNIISLSEFELEQDSGQVKIVDEFPLKFSWSVPPLRYRCSGSIRQLEQGDFRVGFIQYITDYQFQMEYSDRRIIIDVPTPISDSGGVKGDDSPENVKQDFLKGDGQGNTYDMQTSYPWYEPPLKLVSPYKGSRTSRRYFNLRGGDAPCGTGTWIWPWDPQGAASNRLVKIDRMHKFVTCAVLWNNATDQVVKILGKAEWTHKIVIEANPEASVGARLKAKLEHPTPQISMVVQPDFSIPASCLTAPCANGIAGNCIREELSTPAGVSGMKTQSIHITSGDERRFKWEVKEVPKIRLTQTGFK